jgi:hypothetical protein
VLSSQRFPEWYGRWLPRTQLVRYKRSQTRVKAFPLEPAEFRVAGRLALV